MTLNFPEIKDGLIPCMDTMKAICGDTRELSLIDLMCGFAPHTPKLGFKDRTYTDLIDRSLDIKSEQPFFTQQDVLQTPTNKYYDVAICSDGIEHLFERDGYKLLLIMNHISDKHYIFTPTTGFGFANEGDLNPQQHRSTWTPDMLPGYAFVIFPKMHKQWKSGGFFAWTCRDIEKDFERVKDIIMQKDWAK